MSFEPRHDYPKFSVNTLAQYAREKNIFWLENVKMSMFFITTPVATAQPKTNQVRFCSTSKYPQKGLLLVHSNRNHIIFIYSPCMHVCMEASRQTGMQSSMNACMYSREAKESALVLNTLSHFWEPKKLGTSGTKHLLGPKL